MSCLGFGIRRKDDRISALPDSLIHHILSFLPSKNAVATSILSKRWKPIWRSQLCLYFDDGPFPAALAFRQYINSFITLRDNTLPILSYHLKCCYLKCRYLFCDNDFYDFVFSGITKGVQTLITHICRSANYTLTTIPYFVLTTKTLFVLKLKGLALNYVPSVDLPMLKVIHLEYVIFACRAYLKRLLSGCPVLQELETKDLIEQNNSHTMMSPPTGIASLSNLIRANLFDNNIIGLEWFHNVEHLHIQLNRIPSTIMVMFHNLTHLDIIFNFDHPSLEILKWSCLIKLLQNTPNLQTLIIDEVDAERWNEEWEDPKVVPECLLSHLTRCSLRNYSRIYCEFRFAKYIMQNSRVLRTMTIQSAKFLETNAKIQMLIELSSCSRISTTCKFLFI